MKTKNLNEQKLNELEKLTTKSKAKSLRPMRSIMAVRSFRPKTLVAKMESKTECNEVRS